MKLKQCLIYIFILLCLNALSQPVNDERTSAILLTDLNAWSSADAIYSNVGATPDQVAGTCGVVNRNVWFKFQATTNEVQIKLLNGGAKGTIYSTILTVYDNSGIVVTCHAASFGTAYIQRTNLIVGQWYYFSVDDKHTSGTFSLTVSNTIDYDLREKAIQLPSTQSWASTNAEYSNVDATADKISGSCGDASDHPLNTLWLKSYSINLKWSSC